jgi:hypothetical protein
METVFAGRENARFDPADGTDQDRLERRCVFPECIGDGERRHEMSSGAAAGDEYAAGQRSRP